MKSNNGTIVKGVRVLFSSEPTGQQRWYWWLVSLVTELLGDAERRRYVVRALAADTSAPLAARSFDRESTARKARDRFVDVLAESELGSVDPGRVQALLDAVRVE